MKDCIANFYSCTSRIGRMTGDTMGKAVRVNESTYCFVDGLQYSALTYFWASTSY